MENLKTDLEQDEVFVFTPKGRVITLPVGSTTVDFAYAVHTEVGHACIGAKVNGRLVSLDHVLASGDTVEIFTSKVETAGPSQDWLTFVASPRARNKIRQWFSRERRVDMVEAGRDELTSELRRERLPVQQVWKSAQLHEVVTRVELRRPRRPARRHRRAPRVGEVGRPASRARRSARVTRTIRCPPTISSPRAGARRRRTVTRRRPRRGARRRPGAAGELLHADAGRRASSASSHGAGA